MVSESERGRGRRHRRQGAVQPQCRSDRVGQSADPARAEELRSGLEHHQHDRQRRVYLQRADSPKLGVHRGHSRRGVRFRSGNVVHRASRRLEPEAERPADQGFWQGGCGADADRRPAHDGSRAGPRGAHPTETEDRDSDASPRQYASRGAVQRRDEDPDLAKRHAGRQQERPAPVDRSQSAATARRDELPLR